MSSPAWDVRRQPHLPVRGSGPMRRSTQTRVAPCANSTAHTAPCRLVAHDTTPSKDLQEKDSVSFTFLDGGRSWGITLKLSGSRNTLAQEQPSLEDSRHGQGKSRKQDGYSA
jgi:hypothetical protein